MLKTLSLLLDYFFMKERVLLHMPRSFCERQKVFHPCTRNLQLEGFCSYSRTLFDFVLGFSNQAVGTEQCCAFLKPLEQRHHLSCY